MKTIKVTPLQKQILESLASRMYAETGFSDVGLEEIVIDTKLDPKVIRGAASGLIKLGYISIDDRKGEWGINHRDPNTHIWYLQGPMVGLAEVWAGEEDDHSGEIVEPVTLVTDEEPTPEPTPEAKSEEPVEVAVDITNDDMKILAQAFGALDRLSNAEGLSPMAKAACKGMLEMLPNLLVEVAELDAKKLADRHQNKKTLEEMIRKYAKANHMTGHDYPLNDLADCVDDIVATVKGMMPFYGSCLSTSAYRKVLDEATAEIKNPENWAVRELARIRLTAEHSVYHTASGLSRLEKVEGTING